MYVSKIDDDDEFVSVCIQNLRKNDLPFLFFLFEYGNKNSSFATLMLETTPLFAHARNITIDFIVKHS